MNNYENKYWHTFIWTTIFPRIGYEFRDVRIMRTDKQDIPLHADEYASIIHEQMTFTWKFGHFITDYWQDVGLQVTASKAFMRYL